LVAGLAAAGAPICKVGATVVEFCVTTGFTMTSRRHQHRDTELSLAPVQSVLCRLGDPEL